MPPSLGRCGGRADGVAKLCQGDETFCGDMKQVFLRQIQIILS